jgi:HAD superfamily hydrolase (TIGR01509 family)
MYVGMLDKIVNENLLPKLEWDTVIDSSVVGLAKPQIEIFVLAEKLSKFKGEEILFIENTKKHIDKALEMGWNTFYYNILDADNMNKQLENILF